MEVLHGNEALIVQRKIVVPTPNAITLDEGLVGEVMDPPGPPMIDHEPNPPVALKLVDELQIVWSGPAFAWGHCANASTRDVNKVPSIVEFLAEALTTIGFPVRGTFDADLPASLDLRLIIEAKP